MVLQLVHPRLQYFKLFAAAGQLRLHVRQLRRFGSGQRVAIRLQTLTALVLLAHLFVDAALFGRQHLDLLLHLGHAAALAVGLLLGLVNGGLIAFMRLPPFIVTLGTYTALRGAAYLLADGTTVINSDISFEWIGNDYLGPVPWLVVIALAVIAVCWFILRRTTLGVHIYAVGGNMQAARLTGIKVWLVLLFVYGMSGLLSGLGGVMSASRLYSANGNLGTGYELDAIAAVILGGTSFVGGIGTITGTLVGALIIATLNNGMTLMGVSYFWQLVIKGAVIIIAVLIDKYRTRHHQSA